MAFLIRPMQLPDVLLIEPRVFQDDRGSFAETYRKTGFAELGIMDDFVQDNLSHSRQNTLRGLHYQKYPKAQAKLVMVVSGQVFDVAVDIRKNSPTYGQWMGIVLSAEKTQLLYIPRGFAHGFCVLSPEACFYYKVSAEYDSELDRGILWNDPAIGIRWPIPNPLLSAKDQRLPSLQQADHNF